MTENDVQLAGFFSCTEEADSNYADLSVFTHSVKSYVQKSGQRGGPSAQIFQAFTS